MVPKNDFCSEIENSPTLGLERRCLLPEREAFSPLAGESPDLSSAYKPKIRDMQ